MVEGELIVVLTFGLLCLMLTNVRLIVFVALPPFATYDSLLHETCNISNQTMGNDFCFVAAGDANIIITSLL